MEPERPPQSTFRVAIKAGQQGIAYLILDNGYNYMYAMQDALDEQKFQLFLTLIQKTADDATVQKKNDKGQNLMHILAINSASSANQKQVIMRIFNTLRDRGVDCLGQDLSENNALHYAVKCQAQELVSVLLEHGINVNVLNKDGHSPLSLAVRGTQVPFMQEVAQINDPIWLKLLKHGADPNIIYPEDSLKDQKDGLIIPPLHGQNNKKNRDSGTSIASRETATLQG